MLSFGMAWTILQGTVHSCDESLTFRSGSSSKSDFFAITDGLTLLELVRARGLRSGFILFSNFIRPLTAGL
jgi:hypothetical protein